MDKNNKETIMIIDGYLLLHKGYYGSLKRKKIATNRDGVKINAIYTFVSKLNQIIDSNKYRTIIVTFDVDRGCEWRRELYPDYKAKRKETPDDLIPQMQIIRDFLTAAQIPWYEKKNWEGDDVMGTIASMATKAGYKVHILSNDKDCYQLVDENVNVVVKASRNDATELIDEQAVLKKMGCTPKQVIDMKSLMGDSSDNIKGVRYLHYQTATSLIKEYGSVEGIFENLDELKGKAKGLYKRMKDAKDQILTNKKIVTICRDLDLGEEVNFSPLRVNWRGYNRFLKENKMWAYVPYVDNKISKLPRKKKMEDIKLNNSTVDTSEEAKDYYDNERIAKSNRDKEEKKFSRNGGKRNFSRDDDFKKGNKKPYNKKNGNFNKRSFVEPTGEGNSFSRDRDNSDRKPYNRDGGNRNFNRDNNSGERRPYNRDNNGQGRSFNRDNNSGERRPYNRENNGDRKPYNRDGGNRNFSDRKPYNRDNNQEGRTFNRDNNGGERRPYNRDNSDRKPYNRDGGNRNFNRDNNSGERRPYNRDNNGQGRSFNRDNNGGERRPYNNNRGDRKPYNRDGGNRNFQRNDNGYKPRTNNSNFDRNQKPGYDKPKFEKTDSED